MDISIKHTSIVKDSIGSITDISMKQITVSLCNVEA